MTIEITARTRNPEAFAVLKEFSVDLPATGSTPGHLIEVAGWAVGIDSPVVGVDVRDAGAVVAVGVADVPRPDVATALPDLGAGPNCGFRAVVPAPGLPMQFRLGVFVHLADGRVIGLGQIIGCRTRLPSPPVGELEPLLVTSLGRTGTSWLMHVIGRHPEAVVFDRWGYELHAMGFFEKRFRSTVSRPLGSDQPPAFVNWREGSWWGVENLFEAPDIEAWFRGEQVELAAQQCRDDVVSFYRSLASAQGKTSARYFAEKYQPHAAELPLELFGGAREIILVRDFRDMVCSILAFNRNRGSSGFNADLAASDVELPGVLAPGVETLLAATRSRPGSLVVRYEDLITEPESTLAEILRYLGLADDPGVIAATLATANEIAPLVADHRTSASPAESIGRWRVDLDPAVAAACEHTFADALEAFGYLDGSG